MNTQQQAAQEDYAANAEKIAALLKELQRLNEEQTWLMSIISAEYGETDGETE